MLMKADYFGRCDVSKAVKQNKTYYLWHILLCANLPLGYLFGFTVCEDNNGQKSDNFLKYGFSQGNVLHITDRLPNNTDGNGKLSLLFVFILNLGFKQRNYFRTLPISFMVL